MAKMVLPLPGVPPTTVVRARGSPPMTSSSNAATPVLTRSNTSGISISSSCTLMNLLLRFNPEKLQHALDIAQVADDAARALGMFVRECGGGENSGLLGKLGPGE